MKLQPSDQFKPTSTNVSGILNLYGLSCTNFISAKSGIENCTLYVQTNSGTFVLRVYRYAKKAETDIRLEAQFVEYLHAHGIPTAVPICNLQDTPYIQFSSDNKIWYAVLMPFLRVHTPIDIPTHTSATLHPHKQRCISLHRSSPPPPIPRLVILSCKKVILSSS